VPGRARAIDDVVNRFNRWLHRGFRLTLVGVGAVLKSIAIDSTN